MTEIGYLKIPKELSLSSNFHLDAEVYDIVDGR